MLTLAELEAFDQKVVTCSAAAAATTASSPSTPLPMASKFISGNRCDKPVTGKARRRA